MGEHCISSHFIFIVFHATSGPQAFLGREYKGMIGEYSISIWVSMCFDCIFGVSMENSTGDGCKMLILIARHTNPLIQMIQEVHIKHSIKKFVATFDPVGFQRACKTLHLL